MKAYADTGFLVSLYVRDALSAAAIALADAHPLFTLNPLHQAEFANALALRVFRGEWNAADAEAVATLFQEHQRAGVYRPQAWEPQVWSVAAELSRRYSARLGTRSLDVLHVAAALANPPDAFFSFDRRQRQLAAAAGLRVRPARL